MALNVQDGEIRQSVTYTKALHCSEPFFSFLLLSCNASQICFATFCHVLRFASKWLWQWRKVYGPPWFQKQRRSTSVFLLHRTRKRTGKQGISITNVIILNRCINYKTDSNIATCVLCTRDKYTLAWKYLRTITVVKQRYLVYYSSYCATLCTNLTWSLLYMYNRNRALRFVMFF